MMMIRVNRPTNKRKRNQQDLKEQTVYDAKKKRDIPAKIHRTWRIKSPRIDGVHGEINQGIDTKIPIQEMKYVHTNRQLHRKKKVKRQKYPPHT